jgi:rod shape-determining protein MreD
VLFRALITSLTLFVLWVVVSQLNHVLAEFRIYIFAGGLFVVYAALALPLRAGFGAVILGGLLCDSGAPVPFGTHMFLFSVAFAILFNLRDRVPRDETVARVIIALLVNLGLFLALSFALIGRIPSPGLVWPRLIMDLICSQILIAIIAPWFFALQARSLILAKIERDPLD